MIHIDSSVLIDLLGRDPLWGERSLAAFRAAAARDDVAITDIVYSELAPGFDRLADLDETIAAFGLRLLRPPRSALFLAGQMFKRYKRLRGTKTGVLPDFLVGAHAVVEGATLLTRDAKRIRAYFPTVALIAP